MGTVKVDHDNDPTTPPLTMKVGGDYPTPWLIHLVGLSGVYRFFLGRPMDNVVRTDATFWHRGTKGYPSRWLRLAGWERLVVRLACLYLLAWLVVILAAAGVAWLVPWAGAKIGKTWAEPAWTQTFAWWRVLLWHIGVLVGLTVPVLIYVRVRDYGFQVHVPVLDVVRVPARVPVRVHLDGWVPLEVQGRKVWELEHVRPVALAAARVLDLTVRPDNAREWVEVPRNFRDPEGDPVVVRLPANFVPDKGTQDRLVKAVGARLGMSDPVASYLLAGGAPRLELSAPQEPPTLITYADVLDLLLAAEEYRPLMGLTGKATALHAEMVADSPHIAVSAGPGAGKSTLAKLVAMQALRWGWGVVILDWKMTEAYDWAKGLPGVTYLTELEAIHDFGVRIAEEIDIRKRQGMKGRAKVLVIRDEWNITADLLMAYYQDLRQTADPEERKTMPTKSPALRGYATLDFAGREYGAHDFVVGQRLSARAFNGNADIRECFAIRCLARYSDQTKKMLVGNMKPFPKKSNVPGRWTIVAGEDVAVVQVPLITGEEAREYALGGKPNPSTPLTSSYYPEELDATTQRHNVDHGLGDQLRTDATPARTPIALPAVPATDILPPADPRKLSDMVDALEPLGITHNVLRNAARADEKGDPNFPAPVDGNQFQGYRYDFHMVREWARKRHAERQAQKVRR
jgi:hypothetical protein